MTEPTGEATAAGKLRRETLLPSALFATLRCYQVSRRPASSLGERHMASPKKPGLEGMEIRAVGSKPVKH